MKNDEPFTPGSVDEQVEQLSSLARDDGTLLPGIKVVQRLQALYEADKRSTERVWERLAREVSEHDSETRQPEPMHRWQQERTQHMHQLAHSLQQSSKRNTFRHRLGLLAAVILMAVLVGSMITVFHLARQQSTGQLHTPQHSSTAGSTPGQIVYSTPQENGWVSSLAWSANSQRIAAAIGNNAGENISIWDATTGQHKVTISLTLSPLANPAWSPTSDLLAVPTNNAIVIVNGQSGKILQSFHAPATTALSTGTLSSIVPGFLTEETPLATRVPLGGAPNFGGIAWSPDGKWLVSTFSSATSAGLVQVWNPVTGKLAFTLATEPGYAMDAVSWSPDGQYIAVDMGNWNNQNDEQINVWSVKTHQIVFRQVGSQQFDGSSWQPGTDNLAAAILIPGSDSSLPGPPTYNTAVLKIWNVTTKQLIKSFSGVDEISWSPNGHEFAYGDVIGKPGTTAGVTILDVKTGQKVYRFQVSDPAAQQVGIGGVWSPNGKYIVSAESIQSSASASPMYQQSYIVKVWVA